MNFKIVAEKKEIKSLRIRTTLAGMSYGIALTAFAIMIVEILKHKHINAGLLATGISSLLSGLAFNLSVSKQVNDFGELK